MYKNAWFEGILGLGMQSGAWLIPPKEGKDSGYGRPAPVSQIVDPYLGPLWASVKKDWALFHFHAWLDQFSSYKNGAPYFRILEVWGLRF